MFRVQETESVSGIRRDSDSERERRGFIRSTSLLSYLLTSLIDLNRHSGNRNEREKRKHVRNEKKK